MIPEKVTELDSSVFAHRADLVGVTVAGTVKEIPHMAFYHCSNLQQVILKEGM